MTYWTVHPENDRTDQWRFCPHPETCPVRVHFRYEPFKPMTIDNQLIVFKIEKALPPPMEV